MTGIINRMRKWFVFQTLLFSDASVICYCLGIWPKTVVRLLKNAIGYIYVRYIRIILCQRHISDATEYPLLDKFEIPDFIE